MCETLPNDWRKTSLKNVANIRFSGVDKKSKPGERKVKLCNYIDVYDNEYITREIPFMEATASISEIETFSVSEGDVMITKDSETPFDIGVPSVVSEPLENVICGYHLAHIKPKLEEIDPIFLAKQLCNDRIVRYFSQQANGVTRYGLSTAAIENISIWLPSTIDEQKTISKVVRNIDSIIKHTEAKIDKLGRIKDGLMHDLLTKGIDENGQIRDPENYPEQFKDSPLGKIPTKWEPKTIDQLSSHVGSGVTPRGGSNVYLKEGILFIRSQNVTFQELLLDDAAYISEVIHQGMSNSQLQPYDVLINITGASIGRCCVFPDNIGEANVNQHVCAIRLHQSSQSRAEYLWRFLSSYHGQRQVFRFNAGGNREGLNYQQLRSFLIPWPESKDEVEYIASALKSNSEIIAAQKTELGKLKLLKQGLMQDLLTGQVPVPKEMIKEEVC